jgi:hypothetical protein
MPEGSEQRQYIGFNVYTAKAHAWGSSKKVRYSESKGPLVYVGNLNDIARLSDSLQAEASGRVRPQGYGPDR